MPDWFLTPVPPADDGDRDIPLLKRLGWFVLLAIGSGLTTIVAAFVLRGLLFIE